MASLNLQAETAHRQGDLDEAARLYKARLQVNALDAYALYGLGTLAMQEGRVTDALPLLAQAVAIEPDAGEIAYNYAICLHRSGDAPAAVRFAEQASTCTGVDEAFLLMLCRLLLRLNKPQVVLKQLSRLSRQSQRSMTLRGRALGALGEWGGAVAILRELSQDHESSPDAARELSLAAGRLRDYALAIESYDRYLSLITPGAAEFVQFADLYLLARDPVGCAVNLKRAAEAGANSTEYHLLRARLARLNGDYEQAKEASEAAVTLRSDNVQAWSVKFELAPLVALPDLIDRLHSGLDIDLLSPYHQQLVKYVLADAHARLGEAETAFAHYAAANSRQKENFLASAEAYDVVASQSECDEILRQFAQSTHYADVPSDRATPIFILGMPRSGTTLVERMLAQLPMVTAGGENETLGFLKTRYRLDINAGKYGIPQRMTAVQWSELSQLYFEKTEVYNSLSSARDPYHFVTDKMPHNFYHVGMILSLFPTARIIQLRRDPRDVCWSIFTRMFPDSHRYSCDLESIAHAYHISCQLMDHWARMAPARVLDVSYEALVGDPDSQGQRITNFCGLPWSGRCLEFHKSIAPSFTFSELQVRQAINEQSIGRWKPFARQLQSLLDALQGFGYLATPSISKNTDF